jgi:plasmid stabilization system protein ParE
MDFRVELSDQAQRDIAAIYDWLHVYLLTTLLTCR